MKNKNNSATKRYSVFYKEKSLGWIEILDNKDIKTNLSLILNQEFCDLWNKIKTDGVLEEGDVVHQAPQSIDPLFLVPTFWKELIKQGFILKKIK